MPLNRILLIGGAGNLGTLTLNHLLSSPSKFTVSVLTRESSTVSKDAFPASVEIRKIADDYPQEELVKAFKDVDVIVSTISMMGMHLQFRFIDAAVTAGVKRYFPTEFGLDELPDWLVELRPMFRIKHDVRDYLVEKEKDSLEWTAIVCNVFFEMGIMSGFFGLDWATKTATIIDGGHVKWVATTLDTVAIAIVRSIEREAQTRNKLLLVQDFRTCQKEIFDRVREKTGDVWTVQDLRYDDWLEDAKDRVRQGDSSYLSRLTFATSLQGIEWEQREEFGNKLLDLPTKSFDDAIQPVLKDVS